MVKYGDFDYRDRLSGEQIMSQTASIHFRSGSLSVARSGSAYGQVFISIADTHFPEAEWSDHIVILGWWIGEIVQIWNGEMKSVKLKFMDGPCYLQLTTEKLPYVSVMGRIDSKEKITRNKIDLRQLITSLSTSIKQVIEEGLERSIASRDLDELKASMQRYSFEKLAKNVAQSL